MKIQSAVEEYLVGIEVRKYTPKMIRSYRCNLNLFLRFCAEKLHVETVEALTAAVVRQFSRCMSEAGRKGTYINGVLKSIKSFIALFTQRCPFCRRYLGMMFFSGKKTYCPHCGSDVCADRNV